jgi:hypothetical protein
VVTCRGFSKRLDSCERCVFSHQSGMPKFATKSVRAAKALWYIWCQRGGSPEPPSDDHGAERLGITMRLKPAWSSQIVPRETHEVTVTVCIRRRGNNRSAPCYATTVAGYVVTILAMSTASNAAA